MQILCRSWVRGIDDCTLLLLVDRKAKPTQHEPEVCDTLQAVVRLLHRHAEVALRHALHDTKYQPQVALDSFFVSLSISAASIAQDIVHKYAAAFVRGVSVSKPSCSCSKQILTHYLTDEGVLN